MLCIVLVFVMINACVMIWSPEAWFKLPRWLRLQGVLTIEQYGRGWGAAQLRILGAIILFTIFWVGYDLLPTLAR